MARPTGLTAELQVRIVDAIKAGNYTEVAAEAAGVSKRTYYYWMERGRKEAERLEQNPSARPRKSEAPFLQFFQAVKQAKAEAELRDLSIISNAARSGNWQAAAWKLERSHPERWGKKETTEHTGIVRIEDTRERLAERIEKIAKRRQGADGDNRSQTGGN